MTEPIIIDNLPNHCDTCGAGRAGMHIIEQVMERPTGKIRRTVGYHCDACDTSHLYSMAPPEPDYSKPKPPLVLEVDPAPLED